MSEVVKMENPASINVALTPMDMIERAVTSGASVEALERLMALQERWEANQGRKEFDAAIASAKAEIAPIIRNAKGHNDKKYADFAAIARTVDPILSKNGLSYRFRSAQTDRISVTCVLSHRGGHSEETTLSGPPDMTGNKNAIQAIGSTLTYLQRYSLVQILGLAASNDDDGRAAGGGTINADQFVTLRNLMDEAGADEAKFLQFLGAPSFEELTLKQFDTAVSALRKKIAAKGAK